MIEWATFTISIPYPSSAVVWQVFLWWALASVFQLLHFTGYLFLQPGVPMRPLRGVLLVAFLAPALMTARIVLGISSLLDGRGKSRRDEIDEKLGGQWGEA